MIRRLLRQGLCGDPAVALEHLRALAAMHLEDDQEAEHDYLYECLSILDTKSAALLQFNSILVATSAIALSIFNRDVTTGSVMIFLSLVAAGISCALCLSVIWLFWTETDDIEDKSRHFADLLRVRDSRTVRYRYAWIGAMTSLILLVVGLFLYRRYS
jgi:hypothetical protein